MHEIDAVPEAPGLKRWTSPLLALVFALALWPPAAADVIYIYDDVGRLTGVIDAAGDSAGYRYDAAGNLVGIQRAAPGGPAITSFTPATGGIGAAVTISGTGFGAGAGDNKVTFNGVPAVSPRARRRGSSRRSLSGPRRDR